jgi:hypothetical protein
MVLHAYYLCTINKTYIRMFSLNNGQLFCAPRQAWASLARLFALYADYVCSAHHGATVYLPKGVRAELWRQARSLCLSGAPAHTLRCTTTAGPTRCPARYPWYPR